MFDVLVYGDFAASVQELPQIDDIRFIENIIDRFSFSHMYLPTGFTAVSGNDDEFIYDSDIVRVTVRCGDAFATIADANVYNVTITITRHGVATPQVIELRDNTETAITFVMREGGYVFTVGLARYLQELMLSLAAESVADLPTIDESPQADFLLLASGVVDAIDFAEFLPHGFRIINDGGDFAAVEYGNDMMGVNISRSVSYFTQEGVNIYFDAIITIIRYDTNESEVAAEFVGNQEMAVVLGGGGGFSFTPALAQFLLDLISGL